MRTSFAIAIILVLIQCTSPEKEINFTTDSFQLSINESGMITRLADINSNVDYLSSDTLTYLLALRLDSIYQYPEGAMYDQQNQLLTLKFSGQNEARIEVLSKKNFITLELLSLSNSDSVDLVVWGPFPTTIRKTIGETVGVVRGEEFAIGIQSLNPKTLGGFPWQENDCMPQIDIFEQDDYSDLKEEGKRHVLYRVEAAKPYPGGSTLQAYCRNRNRERVVANWGHERYIASSFDDGGVIGSKIALFGVPVEKALETIGEIEVEEGLPHPMIDDEWGKKAASASSAYIILEFSEENFDKALEVTKKAGLRYLYHPEPFEYWGHFKLREDLFPSGRSGLKKLVKKAEENGVMIGLHTLSNFITTNDPYVTPIPDPRLAKVGISYLSSGISSDQTEIAIESPDYFNQFGNNHLKTVQINNELIRYGSVTEQAPWKLKDCQRGSFGTEVQSHKAGDRISKLADHGYKVFLTNPELSVEMSKNIADLYNETGLRQISFDGLEGNRSTGLGNYGEVLFTQTWFENLNDNIRSHYIADASRTSHFFWHMYTRMNWGEPWYAGFRESQTDYRIKNQAYFQRNMMPAMLGWFRMTSSISLEDVEWMLARSAAYNAGYAFVTSFKALEENGNTEEILNTIGLWEKARISGAFSVDQRIRMEDLKSEFHLETVSEDAWNLIPVHSFKYTYAKKVRQPGEPLYETYTLDNPEEPGNLNFIITAVEGNADDLKFEIDNLKTVKIPIELKEGHILSFEGGDAAINQYLCTK